MCIECSSTKMENTQSWYSGITYGRIRFFILFLFVLSFSIVIPQMQSAWAIPTISFDVSTYTMGDEAVITVNDPTANLSPTTVDTVTVTVKSTTNPSGIPVTLIENGVNTGIFTNKMLIFTFPNSTAQYSLNSKIKITVIDPTLNTDPSTIQTVSTSVVSAFPDLTLDSQINPFVLSETGPNTGIFSASLQLTNSSTSSGALHVTPSDILQVTNLVSGKASNALISPTSNGVDAIQSNIGDTITASYPGATSSTASIVLGIGGGGGGGGLIRPGLVLDAIAGLFGVVGGSPYVVSPPSFGGLFYHFSDGLILTQGNNKTIFDISHYNQEIPKQVMVAGEQVNMTFKTFESYYSKGVIHMGLYLIPRGQDMVTTNSIAFIEWQQGEPIQIKDPNHILFNATASSNSDGKFQYTQFSFIPLKSYEKMSFLIRTWNDHMYTTDIRVHDAIEIPLPFKTLPAGLIRYDNFTDLQTELQKEQFYKPTIMSHIHDTSSVFPNSNGDVYWLYDTINHSVTLVICDANDNEVFSYKSVLQPYDIEKKGDYKFMYFTVKQLNRWNIEQIHKEMKVEEEKAMSVGIEKKIMPHSNW